MKYSRNLMMAAAFVIAAGGAFASSILAPAQDAWRESATTPCQAATKPAVCTSTNPNNPICNEVENGENFTYYQDSGCSAAWHRPQPD
ncbi:hypothetical protein [Sinomicrobium sp. M5D2P9]